MIPQWTVTQSVRGNGFNQTWSLFDIEFESTASGEISMSEIFHELTKTNTDEDSPGNISKEDLFAWLCFYTSSN